MLQQGEPVTTLLIIFFGNTVVLRVSSWVVFVNPEDGEETGDDQQCGPNVESDLNSTWNNTLWCDVLNTKPSEQEWENSGQNGTRVG